MSDKIVFISKNEKINLINYLEKAKRQHIDSCGWAFNWQYAHGEGRGGTTKKNKYPTYIAYQRTSDGEHRTRLAIKINRHPHFLTADEGEESITTEICWGKEAPLMKDVLEAYQAHWGIAVDKTQSEEEAE
ncbi:hypothetical protein H9Q72_005319 [Fusarium xylarioides]|uniref:Uncharacterized protein n=1 Tax=Fusarium xylarioides TaxID=221167 RepID=A0A9P7HZW2_9HYPO|nr:hypothetical protein H9Q70_008851 [Fusarium xylarioides]KAG5766655.1 hypothetical protein H9Q72_005319 [Fusarium xylarioides]KAG5775705.1 hypothetical protein H9Q73_010639 [Fusarium xylarioides]KAG5810244.1 hypothetical protein H9Q71_005601 [Fusarium xylarioides]KAG5823325.1 hypothetical protein H9Q74_006579 [Fusarium xylarioides]